MAADFHSRQAGAIPDSTTTITCSLSLAGINKLQLQQPFIFYWKILSTMRTTYTEGLNWDLEDSGTLLLSCTETMWGKNH